MLRYGDKQKIQWCDNHTTILVWFRQFVCIKGEQQLDKLNKNYKIQGMCWTLITKVKPTSLTRFLHITTVLQ